jgi:hypothetical protein
MFCERWACGIRPSGVKAYACGMCGGGRAGGGDGAWRHLYLNVAADVGRNRRAATVLRGQAYYTSSAGVLFWMFSAMTGGTSGGACAAARWRLSRAYPDISRVGGVAARDAQAWQNIAPSRAAGSIRSMRRDNCAYLVRVLALYRCAARTDANKRTALTARISGSTPAGAVAVVSQHPRSAGAACDRCVFNDVSASMALVDAALLPSLSGSIALCARRLADAAAALPLERTCCSGSST